MPKKKDKTKNSKVVDRLILGDCLDVLSDLPADSLDLIYIDPPFCTGREFKGEKLKIAPGGRIRDGEEAKEFRLNDVWEGRLNGYLAWLRPRLTEMRRLLTPNGAILVHLDWHASHYVKVLLDEIMDRDRFVNEIIWHYKTGGHTRRRLSRKFDSIFWYSRDKEYTYNPEAAALPRNQCRLCNREIGRKNHMKRRTDDSGRVITQIKSAGRIYEYYEDDPAPPCDVWLDIPHLHQRDPERTGYPTQKPLRLLERLIALCTRPGDRVADFFAGSGTTLVAASRLGRQWLGCDASEAAVNLASERLCRLDMPHLLQAGGTERKIALATEKSSTSYPPKRQ